MILKVGQIANCECGDCGRHNIVIGEFASKCQNCGASVDPYTGKVLVHGEEAKDMGFLK